MLHLPTNDTSCYTAVIHRPINPIVLKHASHEHSQDIQWVHWKITYYASIQLVVGESRNVSYYNIFGHAFEVYLFWHVCHPEHRLYLENHFSEQMFVLPSAFLVCLAIGWIYASSISKLTRPHYYDNLWRRLHQCQIYLQFHL